MWKGRLGRIPMLLVFQNFMWNNNKMTITVSTMHKLESSLFTKPLVDQLIYTSSHAQN